MGGGGWWWEVYERQKAGFQRWQQLGEFMRKICNIKELMFFYYLFCAPIQDMPIGTARTYSKQCTQTISENGDPIFGSQLKKIMAFNLISWKMLVMKVKR